MRKMLFGGALMSAGLHGTCTQAQVTNVSISYTGSVPNQLAYDGYDPNYGPTYVDTGVNESFDVSGGLALLPFSRTATGGSPFAYGFLSRDFVTVSGDGSLSSSGVFEFEGSVRADGSYITEVSSHGGGISVEFTVDSPGEYELSAYGSYDNDYGFAAASLYASDGTLIFSPSTFLFFDETATGTLEPDTYTLSFSAGNAGITRVVFSVIPAPTTSALLVLSSTVVLRRRR